MASRVDSSKLFLKHENAASWILPSAWLFLGDYLVEDGLANDAVLAGMVAVSVLRSVCWRMVSWERYLGVEASATEEYPAIDSPHLEPPTLTLPERLSLWLVPIGYLVVGAVEMGVAVSHAFAGGIAGEIVVGVVYRRINNVELLFRATDA